ncbi:MAG: aspartate aminotransferase family protein [Myxococcota bacterium]
MDPLVARGQAVMTPNYRPAPIVLDHGQGVWVWDTEGRRYLDMVSGIAVSALGHNHPDLVASVSRQAGRLLHTSNLYWNQASIELAEALVETSFGDKVFFCSSGAEANEACIKLARRFQWQRDPRRNQILSFRNSFHGRTMGALTATAQPKYHEGFGPLPEGFVYGEVGQDPSELIGSATAAVIVEPVQGEGGVRPVPVSYLQALRARCDEVGALVIVDEVQAGVGRTGDMYAYMASEIRPDLMALAKGVGGGLPLGALVARSEVAEALQPGTHGTTYGGSPIACAGALVVMEAVRSPGFLENVKARGEELLAGLRAIDARRHCFSEVRGRGLMVGADLRPRLGFDAKAIVDGARGQGVLVHVAGPRTLRMVPPLVIESDHVEQALGAVDACIGALLQAG